jgi:hypothetical protein
VRHRAVIETLCSQLRFYNSINNLYLIIEPRPSSEGCLAAKTGRGEGGLLCVGN